jgi:hypothetical protein
MQSATRVRVTAGLAGLVSGAMLMDATGLTFAVGWSLSGIAIAVLFAAAPPPRRRRVRLRQLRLRTGGARRPSPSATAQW